MYNYYLDHISTELDKESLASVKRNIQTERKRKKQRLAEIKIILLLMFITSISLATPIAVTICCMERGYFAIGGEWAGLMLIPFCVHGLICTYKDMFIDCSNAKDKHRYMNHTRRSI